MQNMFMEEHFVVYIIYSMNTGITINSDHRSLHKSMIRYRFYSFIVSTYLHNTLTAFGSPLYIQIPQMTERILKLLNIQKQNLLLYYMIISKRVGN